MGDYSAIEWCDATWNPIVGCSRVSEGCRNCYAERVAWRAGQMALGRGAVSRYAGTVRWRDGGPRWTGEVRFVPEVLDQPLRWQRPRRIFVNSMSDLFHEKVAGEWIASIFGVMAASPLHTFQVLTKRPERMLAWSAWLNERGGLGPYIRSVRVDGDRALPNLFGAVQRTEIMRGRKVRSSDDPWMQVFNAAACTGTGPLPNVWLGVSVEDQAAADARIPLLLQTPAAVRFLSVEPLLGPVDLRLRRAGQVRWTACPRCDGSMSVPVPGGGAACPLCFDSPHGQGSFPALDWVIVGGESGPGHRPMDVAWVQSIADQCDAAGVPLFVKQDSGPRPGMQGRLPDDLWARKAFPA